MRKRGLAISAAAAVIGCLINCMCSLKWLRVKHETAFFENLPKQLDGLRVLHITDLHSNSKEKLHINIWRDIDRLEFDIVVITGDLIVNSADELTPHLEYLRALSVRSPVFFTDGNHDVYSYKEVTEALKQAGVRVLNNEKVVCDVDGFGEVSIIGLRDYYVLYDSYFSGVDELFSDNDGSFSIVLSHQPEIFDRVKGYSLGLVLCGHTHGGQVRLPFLPTIYAPGQGLFPKYGDGWYEHDENKMYISRGIGATVFPIRFCNRPEIAVIELSRE